MTPKKALICDDDRPLQQILSHILTKTGFSVLLADDGEKGLASIAEHSPSLIILDMEMPRKDGLQLLKELREKGGPAPYVIMLTSHESAEKRDLALGLGAGEVMIKPFNAAALIKKIEGLIQQGKV